MGKSLCGYCINHILVAMVILAYQEEQSQEVERRELALSLPCSLIPALRISLPGYRIREESLI